MVGQKASVAASDKQAPQTYKDAEALLKIQDEVHRLVEVNNSVTEEIHRAVTVKGTPAASRHPQFPPGQPLSGIDQTAYLTVT
ncbi:MULTISPECIES: hypothetical protein [unclassified Mesorhizobium]|uniref:hypothetical protein n=1 Tax=unclassified Mesorhizobium TaxID=325217 RepID=UPI000BB08A1A|nr:MULTISPECIES: hypothetical protein [unclassified Mesorhizobium]PBC20443.1 hypothetical protein CK226_23090 [Mesorhizobium sp. WSM4311]TRD03984.1 hypothetical protein FJV82_13835 [Mesorhizobium sp. WSM4305]